MIEKILSTSIRNRWGVVVATLFIAIFGVYQLLKLPIDAVPDITNKQVQINAASPILGPLDMEKLVTYPIESAMSGIPGLDSTRSISRNGFSQVTVIFKDRTDLYFARQQIAERLSQIKGQLPDAIEPQMGPVATGLGEVLMYVVEYEEKGKETVSKLAGKAGPQPDGSYLTPQGQYLQDDVAKLAYLRSVQDWMIRPQLRTVPGVAGIDSIGGYEKQFVVQPDAVKLADYGISFSELADALERANVSTGAGFIERGGEAFLVRADGRIRSIDQILQTAIATRGGIPVTVRQVAEVRIGGELRTGAATENGHEVVVGTVLMLAGENSRVVASASAQRLELAAKSAPPGIRVWTVLDRSDLVNSTIGTVQKNLAEGALLVIAVLFWLLGNIRAAIIATLVIPISFLMMAMGMNATGTSGNLMNLGALDFGLIVDGSIIIIENCLRRFAERQHEKGRLLTLPERLSEVFEGSREMIKPTLYGQAIIFLVFIPLLTFTGVEGKTFTPMATTVLLALAGAFLASITFVPATLAIMVRGKVAEKEARAISLAKRKYAPLLRKAIDKPWPWIGAGGGILAAALLTFLMLGSEFMPVLREGNLAMLVTRIPSTSLDESKRMQIQVEEAIKSVPEVAYVFSKTGTAEVASDPMPPSASDALIILKPKNEWRKSVRNQEQITDLIEEEAGKLLGNNFEVSQPIQLRFNELIAGVRGDIAIKIYGDDMETLSRKGAETAASIRSINGASDVRVEQTEGFPTFEVKFDRDAIARYGLSLSEVSDTVSAALGGRTAGSVFEGDQRYDIVVRLDNSKRNDIETLGALPIQLPANGSIGTSIPLRELVQFSFTDGLNQISRENGKRRVVVQANVRGNDLGSFVAEAQKRINTQVSLPSGYHIEWGGQFENLQSASKRLSLMIPLILVAILGILSLAFNGFRPALAVYSAVPLALCGGVFALALRGMPFSVSAAVGFIAVSGVAVLNGLVLMSSITKRIEIGASIPDAIYDGAIERIRPVLMTAMVASLGFLPMALATGTGSEVQKPLATVVIGGLISATFLTLLVLPAVSRLVLRKRTQIK